MIGGNDTKRNDCVIVQDSPKHLLLRAYESEKHVASGDSGYEASPDA
jgi:hypothetical protein